MSERTKVNWVDVPKLESLFGSIGSIKWTKKTIGRNEIDIPASHRNNARVKGAILEDKVQEYAIAMLDGAPFDRITVVPSRAKKNAYVVWDGNQRVAACAEAKVESIGAYVLNVSDVGVEQRLPRILNTYTTGESPSREEMFYHALFFMEEGHAKNRSEAARLARLPQSTFEYMLRNHRTVQRLNGMFFRGADQLNTEVLKHLYSVDNDNTLLALASLSKSYQASNPQILTTGQMLDVIKRVKSDFRTEADQMAYVAQVREQCEVLASRGSKIRISRTRTTFLRLVGSLINTIENNDGKWVKLEITDSKEIEQVKRDVKKLSTMLSKLVRSKS